MLPPLLILTTVSMIKDAYEDYLRHKKDNLENNSTCTSVINGVCKESKWKDLRVGQVIAV